MSECLGITLKTHPFYITCLQCHLFFHQINIHKYLLHKACLQHKAKRGAIFSVQWKKITLLENKDYTLREKDHPLREKDHPLTPNQEQDHTLAYLLKNVLFTFTSP